MKIRFFSLAFFLLSGLASLSLAQDAAPAAAPNAVPTTALPTAFWLAASGCCRKYQALSRDRLILLIRPIMDSRAARIVN